MKLISQIAVGLLLLQAATANSCRCDVGQYFDSASWTCKEPTAAVDYCEYYQKGEDASIKCIACKSGYYLGDNDKCTELTTAIDNCLYAKKETAGIECDSCEEGYYEKEGKCIANPDTDANCKSFRWSTSSSKVKCSSCNEGYYANDDGTCVANPTHEGCSHFNSKGECSACNVDSHYLDENVDPKKCVALADGFTKVDGCSNYEKKSGATEVKCDGCIYFEYGNKSDVCTECPFKWSPPGSSGNVIGFGALLIVLLALLF